jgi:hypothetical protein
MILDRARAVADAVLFEGYLLYPYRASALKNQMRWQFGVLAPRTAECSEPWYARTECLVEADADVTIGIHVRFLQLRSRLSGDTWDEGAVREVTDSVRLDGIGEACDIPFEIPGGEQADDETTFRAWALSGVIRLDTQRIEECHRLRRVGITVENHTPWDQAPSAPRDEMLRHSLISTHTLLAVQGGTFVSLLDPPAWARPAVDACRNEHTWPVLIDEADDVLLSAPIILYDYPAVAAESPGNLFDATEIDEILTLRTMTLTDQEKDEARATDPRAAAIIDRTENLSNEALERMHGTLRYPRINKP